METRRLTKMALLTALLCVSAWISFPLPFSPVPVIALTLVATLTGLMLKPKEAFIVFLVYILLGLIGVPVFAGGTSGLAKLWGPTGGFILSFPIIAFIVGYFSEKFKSTIGIMFGMICSLLISYIIGTLQFCIVTNSDFIKGLTICVAPFIIVDIIKLSIATLVGKSILRRVNFGYSIETS